MASSQTAHSHSLATPNPKPFTIAIVGGGIGGLSLAIGLTSHNVPVHIYETKPSFAEIGAGINLGPNMQRAISLLSPAVAAGVEKVSIQAGTERKNLLILRLGMDLKHATEDESADSTTPRKAGDVVFQFESTRAVGWGKSRATVHRAKLLDEMVKGLPEGITSFNKKLLNVRDGPDEEGVILEFADGTTATADAVIGCDGIRSRVRHRVLGEQDPATQPQFAGVYVYRGLVPMEKAISVMGEEMAGNFVMDMGYDGWVLTYPIDNFGTLNVVAGRYEDGKWEHERWTNEVTKATMLADFEGWGDKVIKIFECIDSPYQWALHDHPPAQTFFRGKACLLGDGAHASTPNVGAGASMAVEDGFILSNLIAAVDNVQDLERAFEVYDEVRRPRTQKSVDNSRIAGEIWALRGEGIGDDLKKLREVAPERWDWTWSYDLEETLKLAIEKLKSK